jgi:radical SAM protein with 4Fe4S-binding SPASM domain
VKLARISLSQVLFYCGTINIDSEKIRIQKPLFDSADSCGAGKYSCVINSNFSISPCDMLTDLYRTDPIDSTDKFQDEWNESDVFKFWRSIKVNDEYCNMCNDIDHCGFGCRAAALAYSNDIRSGDILCLKRKV